MSPKEKAVALLSGGLDSTVALADGLVEFDIVLTLTFDYGQRALDREIEASKTIARHYGIHHEVVPLPWLKKLLPELLNAQHEADWSNTVQLEAQEQAHSVWVPNRNGVFLNIGAAYAEAYETRVILFGANAEEGETFPDNTEQFRSALNAVFEFSTLNHPRVVTPVGHLYKDQIIALALERDVPLNLIWSCYGGEDVQCGECPSCLRLKAALEKVPAGAVFVSKLFP